LSKEESNNSEIDESSRLELMTPAERRKDAAEYFGFDESEFDRDPLMVVKDMIDDLPDYSDRLKDVDLKLYELQNQIDSFRSEVSHNFIMIGIILIFAVLFNFFG